MEDAESGLRKLIERLKKYEVKSFDQVQKQIKATEIAQNVEQWKKQIILQVREQTAPLSGQIIELQNEIKAISKTIIEFMQIIS